MVVTSLDHWNYFYKSPLRLVLCQPDSLHKGIQQLRRNYSGVFPEKVTRYYDPFLGDGSMYFNVSCYEKFINDISAELMSFYELVMDRNKEFFGYLGKISEMWDFLDYCIDDYSVQCYHANSDFISAKRLIHHEKILKSMSFHDYKIECLVSILQDNLVAWSKKLREQEKKLIYEDNIDDNDRSSYLECALHAGLYEYIKMIYNDRAQENSIIRIVCWYFLRKYCYKGIFRKNQDGKFTSPFGGIAKSAIAPDNEVDYWSNSDLTSHLLQTEFSNADGINFLVEQKLQKSDFVYLNPPKPQASSAFSEFKFVYDDHLCLADYLIHECKANWMVLIESNKRIEKYYDDKKVNLTYFSDGFVDRRLYRDNKTKFILIKNY